ncbi:MAG: hypothetical protein EOP51_21530 [Sphingobacteriales bacterium]|nr:MAG: hypothetical protein EOP51_21530 [Sphingobacteriales bacterium]
MKQILLAIMMLTGGSAFAQSQKIDLSKDPANPTPVIQPKDNATLLKESNGTNVQPAQELGQQYSDKDFSQRTTTTTNTIQPVNAAPALNTSLPTSINTTNTQTNLGNGVKANTYIYHDDENKARGSGTTIELGK